MTDKPGQCPTDVEVTKPCFFCNVDDDCKGPLKCCFNRMSGRRCCTARSPPSRASPQQIGSRFQPDPSKNNDRKPEPSWQTAGRGTGIAILRSACAGLHVRVVVVEDVLTSKGVVRQVLSATSQNLYFNTFGCEVGLFVAGEAVDHVPAGFGFLDGEVRVAAPLVIPRPEAHVTFKCVSSCRRCSNGSIVARCEAVNG